VSVHFLQLGSEEVLQLLILFFAFLDALFTTVGCHPTRCSEFESTKNTSPQEYMDQLSRLISDNSTKVVALGEFGLGNL